MNWPCLKVICWRPVMLLIVLLGGSLSLYAALPERLKVGAFSSNQPGEQLPTDWQPLNFSKIEQHTHYSLVEEDNAVVVKAVSEQSASGLIRAISIAPADYPVIEWRWKINRILPQGNVTSRDGDDYPARIYISFAFDPERATYLERLKQQAARLIFGPDTPYRAISYIWGSNSQPGTMVANPFTDRVMMIVVRGGDEMAQQWVSERRNIYEDYLQAFGEEPPMISGVAIMTDTDNTRDTATAWYGDIVFARGS